MYAWLRPWLFRLDAEKAHALTLNLIRWAGILPPSRWLLNTAFSSPLRPVQAFGLTFKNPVGLAAGYDKDAQGLRGLACLGFSHIEAGTVTLQPQTGNTRPRVFRLVEDQAIVNRMGFPGQGARRVVKRLSRHKVSGVIVGVNIGKNKDTPLEQAGEEYAALVGILAAHVDYLAINVSSPNTAGLRRLQGRQYLESLLARVEAARREALQASSASQLPILVKLAPDLDASQLDDALSAIQSEGMDGVIATNTTLDRQGLRSRFAGEAGGLSGEPLFTRSVEMVRQINQLSGGHLPVVGVGGIMNPAGAQAMLDAGAVLVQVYTGLVYAGPGLVSEIVRSLPQPP